jgi:hypothetical protein
MDAATQTTCESETQTTPPAPAPEPANVAADVYEARRKLLHDEALVRQQAAEEKQREADEAAARAARRAAEAARAARRLENADGDALQSARVTQAVRLRQELGLSQRSTAGAVPELSRSALQRGERAVARGRQVGVTGRPSLLSASDDAKLAAIVELNAIQGHGFTKKEINSEVRLQFFSRVFPACVLIRFCCCRPTTSCMRLVRHTGCRATLETSGCVGIHTSRGRCLAPWIWSAESRVPGTGSSHTPPPWAWCYTTPSASLSAPPVQPRSRRGRAERRAIMIRWFLTPTKRGSDEILQPSSVLESPH